MKPLVAALLFAFVPVVASAGEVRVPGEPWSIRFDSPELTGHQEKGGAGDDYAYQGKGGRFFLTFYVEKPRGKGGSHADCHAFYWKHISRKQGFDPASLKTTKTKRFVRAEYDLVVPSEDGGARLHNVNYFFAYGGKWADFHVSMSAPEPGDAAVFAAFDKSLTYGPASKAPEKAPPVSPSKPG